MWSVFSFFLLDEQDLCWDRTRMGAAQLHVSVLLPRTVCLAHLPV